MANRRMFSRSVIETDAFTDMPLSSQALYLHLGMDTDDDGFVLSPRRIQRSIGATDDDMRILAARGFVIPFESGVLVVTHHRMNNTIKNDRYHETTCSAEYAKLKALPSGKYALIDGVTGQVEPISVECDSDLEPVRNQLGTSLEPEHNRTEHNVTEQNRGVLSGRPDNSPLISQVVGYLNERAGTHFKANSKSTVRHINARIAEGYGVDDFKRAVDVKVSQWGKDPNMCRFLRPETLFGPKFEGYVNEGAVKRDDYSQYDC